MYWLPATVAQPLSSPKLSEKSPFWLHRSGVRCHEEQLLLPSCIALAARYRYSENTIAANRPPIISGVRREPFRLELAIGRPSGKKILKRDLYEHKDQPYASSTIARKVASHQIFL